MEKEFVFFTILMLQRDKIISTEIENKWTSRQAAFIISGNYLEKWEIYLSFYLHLHTINSSGENSLKAASPLAIAAFNALYVLMALD